MSADRRQIERWIGAVLVPEVRIAGTIASVGEVVPSREYLERFPPAGLVAFGRTPSGAVSPTKLIEQVRATCRELGNPEPFVACDLEQGAGLHFAEGTRLPPALALASAALSEGEWIHEGQAFWGEHSNGPLGMAGVVTAAEARAFGVDVVLAPVCDVNTLRDNPIIAVRSFGDDATAAAVRAREFYLGLVLGGAAGCAKHFPGHGDTSRDSHVELPRVDSDAARLREIELVPFREVIRLGISCVMIAHLDVPALTGEPGVPCTLSRRAITDVMRGELEFIGLVLSDAMNMGALEKIPDRYVRALEAGCDGLLCPHDLRDAAHELLTAAMSGRLAVARLEDAANRMLKLCDRRAARRGEVRSTAGTALIARAMGPLLADRALRCSPTSWPWERDGRCEVLDPLPSSDSPEVVSGIERMRAACAGPTATGRALLPVICELRAWAGRYGLGPDELAELDRRIDAASHSSRKLALAWFGSPQTLPERLWHDSRVAILLAFAPTPPMFAAVERFLAGAPLARGSLPARLG